MREKKKAESLSHARDDEWSITASFSLLYSIDRLANEDEKCLASSRCKNTAVNNTIAVTRRRECAQCDTF